MIDGEAGDLKFVVMTQPHARFQRHGNDLLYNATISLVEALVGFSKQVLSWRLAISPLQHGKAWLHRPCDCCWRCLCALLGKLTAEPLVVIQFMVQIDHLDGHKVTLQAKGVTIPGAQQVLPKEGMPLHENAHRHGSLHVTYTVAFPRQLSQSQKDAVKKLFGSSHDEL